MQIILNGLIAGVPTALLGVAFALVYLSARAFHIALGGIYALVPFVAWVLAGHGANAAVAIVAAVVAGVLVSTSSEIFNYAPLERRGGSPSSQMITSLGLYIMLVAATAMVWGSEAQSLRPGVDRTFTYRAVTMTESQVLTTVIGGMLLILFFAILTYTRLGLRIRALSDNPDEFALRGHDGQRVRLIAFALSGVLASSAALLVARDVGFSVNGGLPALLIAIAGVIVGGRSSFAGPAVGAFIISIVRAEVTWLMAARWQDAATYILLALVLYVRPSGLLGVPARLEGTP